MKKILGILLIVLGIVVGLYVGLYLCFIGGIIGLIQTVRAPELDTAMVALNVCKIMFSGIAGWIAALLLIFPGSVLTEKE